MILAKMLEAIGIASLAIGLVQGIYGHISFEYYTFIGGAIVFFAGRMIEKHLLRKKATRDGGHDEQIGTDDNAV